jgi:hypothetical protein
VTGDAAAFVALLHERGVAAQPDAGRVLLPAAGPTELAVVRDVAVAAGVGISSLLDAANALEDAVVGAMA